MNDLGYEQLKRQVIEADSTPASFVRRLRAER
jgi:hypothetical protein